MAGIVDVDEVPRFNTATDVPDLLIISNNIVKLVSKQLDTSYASRTIVSTASRRKPNRNKYSSYYYTNISNIFNYLASRSLLISYRIVLNNNPLKYSPYPVC